MPKISKEHSESLKKNYKFLLKELKKAAKSKGITGVDFTGFMAATSGNTTSLDCPCGTETYIDPRTGAVRTRCKKC